jgi:hypothetical protein
LRQKPDELLDALHHDLSAKLVGRLAFVLRPTHTTALGLSRPAVETFGAAGLARPYSIVSIAPALADCPPNQLNAAPGAKTS